MHSFGQGPHGGVTFSDANYIVSVTSAEMGGAFFVKFSKAHEITSFSLSNDFGAPIQITNYHAVEPDLYYFEHTRATHGGKYSIEIDGMEGVLLASSRLFPIRVVPESNGLDITLTFDEPLEGDFVTDFFIEEVTESPYPWPIEITSLSGQGNTRTLHVNNQTSFEYNLHVGSNDKIDLNDGAPFGDGTASVVGSTLILSTESNNPFGYTVNIQGVDDASTWRFTCDINAPKVDINLFGTTLARDGGLVSFLGQTFYVEEGMPLSVEVIRNKKAQIFALFLNLDCVLSTTEFDFNDLSEISFSALGPFEKIAIVDVSLSSTHTIYSANSWNFIHNAVIPFTGSNGNTHLSVFTKRGPLVKHQGSVEIADEGDITLYVNGSPAPIGRVDAYLGEVWPLYPIPKAPGLEVTLDYTWAIQPYLPAVGLNLRGMVLNRFDSASEVSIRTSTGTNDHVGGIDSVTRFPQNIVLHDVPDFEAVQKKQTRYIGFDKSYTAALNDEKALLLLGGGAQDLYSSGIFRGNEAGVISAPLVGTYIANVAARLLKPGDYFGVTGFIVGIEEVNGLLQLMINDQPSLSLTLEVKSGQDEIQLPFGPYDFQVYGDGIYRVSHICGREGWYKLDRPFTVDGEVEAFFAPPVGAYRFLADIENNQATLFPFEITFNGKGEGCNSLEAFHSEEISFFSYEVSPKANQNVNVEWELCADNRYHYVHGQNDATTDVLFDVDVYREFEFTIFNNEKKALFSTLWYIDGANKRERFILPYTSDPFLDAPLYGGRAVTVKWGDIGDYLILEDVTLTITGTNSLALTRTSDASPLATYHFSTPEFIRLSFNVDSGVILVSVDDTALVPTVNANLVNPLSGLVPVDTTLPLLRVAAIPPAGAQRTLGVLLDADYPEEIDSWAIVRTDGTKTKNSDLIGPIITNFVGVATDLHVKLDPAWGLLFAQDPDPDLFDHPKAYILAEYTLLPGSSSAFSGMAWQGAAKNWRGPNITSPDYENNNLNFKLNQYSVAYSPIGGQSNIRTITLDVLRDKASISFLPKHLYASDVYNVVDGLTVYGRSDWEWLPDTQLLRLKGGKTFEGVSVEVSYAPGKTTNTFLLNEPFYEDGGGVAELTENSEIFEIFSEGGNPLVNRASACERPYLDGRWAPDEGGVTVDTGDPVGKPIGSYVLHFQWSDHTSSDTVTTDNITGFGAFVANNSLLGSSVLWPAARFSLLMVFTDDPIVWPSTLEYVVFEFLNPGANVTIKSLDTELPVFGPHAVVDVATLMNALEAAGFFAYLHGGNQISVFSPHTYLSTDDFGSVRVGYLWETD